MADEKVIRIEADLGDTPQATPEGTPSTPKDPVTSGFKEVTSELHRLVERIKELGGIKGARAYLDERRAENLKGVGTPSPPPQSGPHEARTVKNDGDPNWVPRRGPLGTSLVPVGTPARDLVSTESPANYGRYSGALVPYKGAMTVPPNNPMRPWANAYSFNSTPPPGAGAAGAAGAGGAGGGGGAAGARAAGAAGGSGAFGAAMSLLGTAAGVAAIAIGALAITTQTLNSVWMGLAEEWRGFSADLALAKANMDVRLIQARIQSAPNLSQEFRDKAEWETEVKLVWIDIKEHLIKIITPYLLQLLIVLTAILKILSGILKVVDGILYINTLGFRLAKKFIDWVASFFVKKDPFQQEMELVLAGVTRHQGNNYSTGVNPNVGGNLPKTWPSTP